MKKIKVGLVDDHKLIIDAMTLMVNSFETYQVVLQAFNGIDMIAKMEIAKEEPEIILLDVNMPQMNGFETAAWLTAHKPLINLVALSMNDDDLSLIKMIRNGCKGYLLKDAGNGELKKALDEVMNKGFYYNEYVTGKLINTINRNDDAVLNPVKLSKNETAFLINACTEMTYKEIAAKLFVSDRTIDGYRDALFDKLQVKTRVGLVVYAIKNGIVQL
jgi:DNA-binding NarL/FixJ family response regulator